MNRGQSLVIFESYKYDKTSVMISRYLTIIVLKKYDQKIIEKLKSLNLLHL